MAKRAVIRPLPRTYESVKRGNIWQSVYGPLEVRRYIQVYDLLARELAGMIPQVRMNRRERVRLPGLQKLRKRMRNRRTRCYARQKEPVFGVLKQQRGMRPGRDGLQSDTHVCAESFPAGLVRSALPLTRRLDLTIDPQIAFFRCASCGWIAPRW
jgi:hypothetical protein